MNDFVSATDKPTKTSHSCQGHRKKRDYDSNQFKPFIFVPPFHLIIWEPVASSLPGKTEERERERERGRKKKVGKDNSKEEYNNDNNNNETGKKETGRMENKERQIKKAKQGGPVFIKKLANIKAFI